MLLYVGYACPGGYELQVACSAVCGSEGWLGIALFSGMLTLYDSMRCMPYGLLRQLGEELCGVVASDQVEQGLGIGSGAPFFNRATAAMTRFVKLRDPPPGSSAPAPTLVLHTRAGHAIGDMASYDYFTLGGPFSVRASSCFTDVQLN